MFGRKNSSSLPTRRRQRDEPSPSVDSQFRRNRTLSGVRRTEALDESPRAKAHQLAMKRRKIGMILLLVLGGSAVLFLLISQFTAKVIVMSSAKAVSSVIQPKPYEEAINDYLGVHPAGRLRFALNEQELSAYVSALTPEVAKVAQSGSSNLVETRFSITFRQPVAGWQINGHQYYVDDQGIVFEKNYYDAPSLQIIDESGATPEQGSAVASGRLLSFVGRVVALAGEGGYQVTQAILPVGTTREVEIRLKKVAPLVKLSIDRGAGEQVEDMTRTLAYLSSHNINPSYIDVRVSGRAAYR